MRKSTYFLILALLSVEMFDIEPLGTLFHQSGGIYYHLFLLVWMFFGYVKYHKNNNRLNQTKYYNNVKLITLGIILSFIPAYLYQGQSFTQSIITYREQIFWLIIPLIITIRPTEKDIVKALSIFALIFFVMCFVKTYFPQSYFYDAAADIKHGLSERRQIALAGGGFQLIVIPLYYYCNQLSQKVDFKQFLYIFFLLIVIFIAQNRSTLFVAMIIVFYSIFKLRSKYKFLMTVLLILSLLVIFYVGYDSFEYLINSTHDELNDQDYNRNKAYLYFFSNPYINWVTIILGQGFLSQNATTLMADLMDMGIYNSDVGFIGFWNQFGILPVIAFLSSTIGALRKKNIPFYVKAFSLHILLCSVTISYFGNPQSLLWYAFFFYLYIYNVEYNKSGQLITYAKENNTVSPHAVLK